MGAIEKRNDVVGGVRGDDEPDHFCCPLILEMMRIPVILPESGKTYEGDSIQAHFALGDQNHFCPETRIRCHEQPVPNLALAAAIRAYQNPQEDPMEIELANTRLVLANTVTNARQQLVNARQELANARPELANAQQILKDIIEDIAMFGWTEAAKVLERLFDNLSEKRLGEQLTRTCGELKTRYASRALSLNNPDGVYKTKRGIFNWGSPKTPGPADQEAYRIHFGLAFIPLGPRHNDNRPEPLLVLNSARGGEKAFRISRIHLTEEEGSTERLKIEVRGKPSYKKTYFFTDPADRTRFVQTLRRLGATGIGPRPVAVVD